MLDVPVREGEQDRLEIATARHAALAAGTGPGILGRPRHQSPSAFFEYCAPTLMLVARLWLPTVPPSGPVLLKRTRQRAPISTPAGAANVNSAGARFVSPVISNT